MKLYYSPNSAASQRVRLVLEEKQLSYDVEEIDLAAGEQFSQHYLEINPDAVVPTLEDSGQIITESSLICQYLDEAYPAPCLTPKTAAEKFDMRLVLRKCDELHQACGDISYAVLGGPMIALKGKDEIEQLVERMPSEQNRLHRRSVLFQGIESDEFCEAIDQHRKLFAMMNNRLLGGSTWLVGQQVSLADLALAIYVSRVEHVGLLGEVHRYPALLEWYELMKSRPAYDRTFDSSTEFIQAVMLQTGQQLFANGTVSF